MSAMQIGLFQTARMEQRLLQSPQMIQAMQVLQLSSLDLQQRIERELLENPLLERVEGLRDDASGDEPGPTVASGERLEALKRTRERERWDQPPRGRISSEDANRKHEAMQNSPDGYHSLGESLLGELALLTLDDRERRMVEFLVYSLDARGYLPCSLAQLAEECGIAGATEDEFEGLLWQIRRATHPALGATDLCECLLLQVDPEDDGAALLRGIITERLEDVAANRIPSIARSTERSVAEVTEAIERLRELDPFPGSSYGTAPAEVIRPEVMVEELDGAFQVSLVRDRTTPLRISPDYQELAGKARHADSQQRWIRERLGAARWFIDALEQRRNTLLRIAREIFARQGAFLDAGQKALCPLRMQEVADAVEVHISTVSRAVSGKHAQTPQGIFPLRSFFCGGMAGDSGEEVSPRSIQDRMKKVIAEEDAGAPLSDEQLAEVLHELTGVRLARRTITKYRKALAIPSSNLRRDYAAPRPKKAAPGPAPRRPARGPGNGRPGSRSSPTSASHEPGSTDPERHVPRPPWRPPSGT